VQEIHVAVFLEELDLVAWQISASTFFSNVE
jgi:hypothetical protein